jgi:hypothetical protein
MHAWLSGPTDMDFDESVLRRLVHRWDNVTSASFTCAVLLRKPLCSLNVSNTLSLERGISFAPSH